MDPTYYRNVRAYDKTDIGHPMVGWGKSPRAAGPDLIGVGAVRMAQPSASAMTLKRSTDYAVPPVAEESWFPWWGWMAVPLGVGGVLLFAADQGWFGRKAQAVTTGKP